jgi:hypothetical protein
MNILYSFTSILFCFCTLGVKTSILRPGAPDLDPTWFPGFRSSMGCLAQTVRIQKRRHENYLENSFISILEYLSHIKTESPGSWKRIRNTYSGNL